MSNIVEGSFLGRRVQTEGSNAREVSGAGKLWGLLLFLAMTVGFVVLSLALLSYDSNDPGFSRFTSQTKISNIFGAPGAWFSDLIYLLFGWGSWLLVGCALFYLIRGFKRLRGKEVNTTGFPMGVRIFAFVVLLFASCTLFFLRFHTHSPGLPGTTGGVLGSAIGSEILYWTDLTIGTVILLLVILPSFSIFLGFSWSGLVEKIGQALENAVARFRSIRQNKEDVAFGEASLQEREKQLQTGGASPVHEEPPIESEPVIPASELFVPTPQEEKVIGLNEFKPIEYKPEPTFTNEASPAPEEVTLAPVPQEKDIPIEKAEQTAYASLPAEEPPVRPEPKEFVLPSPNLLTEPPFQRPTVSQEELRLTSQRIEHILMNYKIDAKVLSALPGPIITRFKVQPGAGVKSKKFVDVAKDLARGLGQSNVRVVENLREIDCIGLEVPNSGQSVQTIYLKDIINSLVFKQSASRLTLALGKNVAGEPMVIDLAKAPHLLVAGTTGSGKSVGVNAMILSMLYKNTPEQLRLILIDPKEVEFGMYEDIPHLLTPVITDMAEAAHALNWAVKEMDRRYKLFRPAMVRNFDAFNQKVREGWETGTPLMDTREEPPKPFEELPYIVIIIDEYADLMLLYGKEVENQITRLTQKSRAAGMHVILATQRPSADVVTPLIKANCPSRISFQVSNRFDSATILNSSGAEELLGRGDMLYMRPGSPLLRLHGAFVTDEEIEHVTSFLRNQASPEYVDDVISEPEELEEEADAAASSSSKGEDNALYDRAVDLVISENRPSISYIQRRLNIGYNRAANLIEQMEKEGIVSKPTVSGKRQVLAKQPSFED